MSDLERTKKDWIGIGMQAAYKDIADVVDGYRATDPQPDAETMISAIRNYAIEMMRIGAEDQRRGDGGMVQ